MNDVLDAELAGGLALPAIATVRAALQAAHARLLVVDYLVRLIPDYYAYEVRANLYRWAGCQFGAGVQLYGRLNLLGRDIRAGNLSIGAGSNVAPYCVLGIDGAIRVGSLVGLAPFVKIFTVHPAWPIGGDGLRPASGGHPRRVVIEDGAVVMTGATVLPGVTIGRGAIVGAGAVVTEDVAPNTFAGGVPARPIRRLAE
jgi:acetyltransferase-like isoleucine patch superfamily enzyme